ncbi:MAG: hypothetical protein AB7K09_05565 [Planctomycetota bacterium]
MTTRKKTTRPAAPKKRRASKAAGKKAGGGAASSTDDAALRAVLELVDAAGESGLPVAVPAKSDTPALGKAKKDGSLAAPDQKRLDKLGVWSFVDQFGETTIDGVTTSLCTLNAAGRNKLAEAREAHEAARSAELQVHLQNVDGIRETLEHQSRRVDDLQHHLDALQHQMVARVEELAGQMQSHIGRLAKDLGHLRSDSRLIADTLQQTLLHSADAGATAVALPVPAMGDTDFVRTTEAALAEPEIAARSTAAARAASDARANLAAAVLRLVPEDHWMEIPELFRTLRAEGSVVLPGQLNDLLLALAEAGRIAFNIWMRTLTEIPAPEHGILQPDAKVLYYVRRAAHDPASFNGLS